MGEAVGLASEAQRASPGGAARPSSSPSPSLPIRLLLATVAAVLAVAYVRAGMLLHPDVQTDFDQLWYGARALRVGQDPYAVIGPGRAWSDWPFPLFYPVPALLPALPLSYLGLQAAREVFAGASAWCFTFLLLRLGYQYLATLLSASFLLSVTYVQFAPLLACAVLSPAFGWVTACKPNIGIAVAATARSNRGLAWIAAGVGSMVLASFLLSPGWPSSWLAALSEGIHFAPYALRPGGVLLLLALLRWRRPEARWLAVMSLLPGNPGVQESLILFTAPHSLRSILLLALGTHAAAFAVRPMEQFPTYLEYVDTGALAMLAFVYLPTLLFILRRPNEGEVPTWIEECARRVALVSRRLVGR